MLKLALLCVALSGLHAAPLAPPRGLDQARRIPDGFRQDTEPSTFHLPNSFRQGTEPSTFRTGPPLDNFRQGTEPSTIRARIPDGFRQGTEPSRRYLIDLNTGLVREHVSEMDRRAETVYTHLSLGKGFKEMERSHRLIDDVPVEAPVQRSGEGWVRVEEPSTFHLPDGYRQGTEPMATIPDGFRQGTEPMISLPQGFRQGTEPMISLPEGFRQGTEPMISLPQGFRQGTEPMISLPEGFRQGTEPMISLPEGFRQGTEPMISLPEGFRQGTEPMISLPEGFRQGTEPMISLPEGFRQGTEPMISLPQGFRQGTEPMISLPEGFRQGTEPTTVKLPEGFRQGTEPIITIPKGFRQGTEPSDPWLPEGFRQGTEPSTFRLTQGFRQGTEPSTSRLQIENIRCGGEIINGRCYEFNPTPLVFKDAQSSCRALAAKADLVSVTNGDLHSRLVSMVTKAGTTNPVLTWLGGVVKNQQAEWVDGSQWGYSDWMPGHPNIHTDRPVCLEMFRIDESWWTAVDCELKRASICSYPLAA